jgi:hypothetical protein
MLRDSYAAAQPEGPGVDRRFGSLTGTGLRRITETENIPELSHLPLGRN